MATPIKVPSAVTQRRRALFPILATLAFGLAGSPAAAQQPAPAPAPAQPAPAPAGQTPPAQTAPAKPKPQKPKPDATAPAQPAAAKPQAQPKPAAAKPPAAAPAKPAPAQANIQPGAPPAANATSPNNTALGLGAGSGPVDITSDESLEMQQSNKVYIARGNAIAKRGDRTLYADIMKAYYRDIPNSSQTEIWRVEADGHVKITTPTQTVIGDHAVDDLDTKTDIITGQDLKLTTPIDVVTARDALEWYEDKSVAVARGDALAIRHTPTGDRRIRGDILVALVVQPPGEQQRISRVDATGHVVVASPDQVGTGDKGVYDADTGLATLTNHVTLARGQNTLRGEYGVVDLDRGVSRLLPRPPTEADHSRGRVSGYIIPHQKGQPEANAKPGEAPKPAPAPAPKPGPQANSAPVADSTQKAQPDTAKPR